MRKLKWIVISAVSCVVAGVLIANYKIEKSTDNSVYTSVDDIPYNKVGLLLGTSKYVKSGRLNQYFMNRIQSTFELYNAHKIDFIVISGDNSKKDYNEPLDMKEELIKAGIPENRIYLDYAGFRTYDSIVRMYKIFGQTGFTIISQGFHNRRAIYIADHIGLHTVGFNAQDVGARYGFKTNLREKFSRVKVFIDLWMGKEPKFLGEKIEIE